MIVSIALSWWIAPVMVTLLIWAWFFWVNSGPSSSGYAAIGDGIVSALTGFVALTVSLGAWLIWALLR